MVATVEELGRQEDPYELSNRVDSYVNPIGKGIYESLQKDKLSVPSMTFKDIGALAQKNLGRAVDIKEDTGAYYDPIGLEGSGLRGEHFGLNPRETPPETALHEIGHATKPDQSVRSQSMEEHFFPGLHGARFGYSLGSGNLHDAASSAQPLARQIGREAATLGEEYRASDYALKQLNKGMSYVPVQPKNPGLLSKIFGEKTPSKITIPPGSANQRPPILQKALGTYVTQAAKPILSTGLGAAEGFRETGPYQFKQNLIGSAIKPMANWAAKAYKALPNKMPTPMGLGTSKQMLW